MSEHFVNEEYPLSDITARIIAAATQVHKALGPGFEDLKASGYKVGLLLNFGAGRLQIRRLAN